MVWAFGAFTGNSKSDSSDGMQFHNSNANTWTLQVNSDGSMVSGGNNGLPIPTPVT